MMSANAVRSYREAKSMRSKGSRERCRRLLERQGKVLTQLRACRS